MRTAPLRTDNVREVSRVGQIRDEMEPRIAQLMDLKLARRETGPYRVANSQELEVRLAAMLPAIGQDNARLTSFGRMPGGASKEQFFFAVDRGGGEEERLVLRVDPLEAIVETCRYREAEVLNALRGIVPLAQVRFVDGDGSKLGAPSMATTFVNGVTKPPSDGNLTISGVGTSFNAAWRERLLPQFLGNLTAIHKFDWRKADLPHFSAPLDFPGQAALWQVNWWTRVWREDAVAPYPMLTLAEQWLRRNLPECREPVLVHGDFRTGNFMFDAETGEMTAVLDWELAHIGDFHEDLAWILQRLFATPAETGELMACGLITREGLIKAYESATGSTVNRRTLAFYEILCAFKCAAMNLGTGSGIAARGNNHQDVLLSWMAPVGHVFCNEIARLISEEMAS